MMTAWVTSTVESSSRRVYERVSNALSLLDKDPGILGSEDASRTAGLREVEGRWERG